jgi:hypothetical protein
LASYPYGISQVNLYFGGLNSANKVLCGTNVDYGTGWIAASRYCREQDRIAMIDDAMIRTELDAMGIMGREVDSESVNWHLRSADVGRSSAEFGAGYRRQPVRSIAIVAGSVRVETGY